MGAMSKPLDDHELDGLLSDVRLVALTRHLDSHKRDELLLEERLVLTIPRLVEEIRRLRGAVASGKGPA
jgi:hypothetical protein